MVGEEERSEGGDQQDDLDLDEEAASEVRGGQAGGPLSSPNPLVRPNPFEHGMGGTGTTLG
jgi:hypothetical protein